MGDMTGHTIWETYCEYWGMGHMSQYSRVALLILCLVWSSTKMLLTHITFWENYRMSNQGDCSKVM
jgi:hypothetical protein